MATKNLFQAKKAKKDEFYTQLADIENELRHYREHFRGKTVLCNCDDPYESNFFKYFALNFNQLGLKKLIATCYDGSPVQGKELVLFCDNLHEEPRKAAYKVEITAVDDVNGDGAIDLSDVRWLLQNDCNAFSLLDWGGDFRHPKAKALLQEADIVVTNPPFSLFREYVAQLMEYDKKLFNERYFHDSNTGAVINVTGASAGYEGKTVNMHPTMCTIWIDRRYTKGETVESAEKELREVLDTVDGLKGSYEIEKLYSCVRSTISADDPDIIKGMKAYETVFKTPIHPGRRNGGGDAVKLSVAYNQRVPQLGPGVYDVLGTNDEYVPLSQFLNYIKVYMLFTVNYFE